MCKTVRKQTVQIQKFIFYSEKSLQLKLLVIQIS